MSDVEKKPYLIRVTVQSISNGVENQLIDLTEGATSEQELVMKCFAITDAVDNAMKALAQAGGFLSGSGPGKSDVVR